MASRLRVYLDVGDARLRARLIAGLMRTDWEVVSSADAADVVLRATDDRVAPIGLHQPRDDEPDAPLETLTPREHDVLTLLADGAGNRAIAERLGVSDHTVKFHLSAIFGKLGVTTRTAAVRRALRLGWIDT